MIPLSLYVHVPWCERKCPYCDFNSHVSPGPLPEAAYLGALCRDLDCDLDLAGQRTVETIFIGGGTPSLLSVDFYARLLEAIRTSLALAPQVEITLEANPGTVKPGYLRELRAAGINRLSLGVQSFDDGLLTRIGRIHDARQALSAAEDALTAGFANLNLDLMFGLPGQDLAMAQRDLAQAIALAPEHISYYQLTLEPNTAFGRRPPQVPVDEVLWRMQHAGVEQLARSGYRRYEISAYARGRQCKHNHNYWEFGDYLGIGAGAHGKAALPSGGYLRTFKSASPTAYLKQAGSLTGLQRVLIDRPEEAVLEFMLNALRLVDGIPERLLTERTGVPFTRIEPICQRAVEAGLLDAGAGVLKATAKGLRFLDTLLEYFVVDSL